MRLPFFGSSPKDLQVDDIPQGLLARLWSGKPPTEAVKEQKTRSEKPPRREEKKGK